MILPSRRAGSLDELVVARSARYATHTEWYVTGRPGPRQPAAQAIGDVYAAVADLLATENITILQEKVYGRRAARDHILSSRREAFSRRRLGFPEPVAFVEGTPPAGALFGGVQLWGVALPAGDAQQITRVEWDGQIVGREWTGPGFRQLVLTSVGGAGTGRASVEAPAVQAQRMLETASSVLGARGYTFRNVTRTWIYLSRILDWYGEFNRVRNVHFSAAGLSTAREAMFPASTGIQGRHDGEECVMDLLAIDASPESGFLVRPILRSARQDQAFAYGSAFSRAMVIERDGKKVIHVSGTASIDTGGRSRHAGDAAAQYCETLLSIGALLEEEDASIADIVQGTLFCKSTAVAKTCEEAARHLRLPNLPLIEVVADVCRPELLVEIEAVALV